MTSASLQRRSVDKGRCRLDIFAYVVWQEIIADVLDGAVAEDWQLIKLFVVDGPVNTETIGPFVASARMVTACRLGAPDRAEELGVRLGAQSF